jgi:hypothetical protein
VANQAYRAISGINRTNYSKPVVRNGVRKTLCGQIVVFDDQNSLTIQFKPPTFEDRQCAHKLTCASGSQVLLRRGQRKGAQFVTTRIHANWRPPMSATSEERRAGQRDVEHALVRLLTMYSAVSRSLSEWEQYCLSSALIFERHGYFEKALIKIGEVFEPPIPLPSFPKPPPITLDDISRHVTAAAEKLDPGRRPQAGPKR